MNLWDCGVDVSVLKYESWVKIGGEIIVFSLGYNNSNANESNSRWYYNNIYCKQKQYSENIKKYYFTENVRNLQKHPTKMSKMSNKNVQNDQDIRNI